MGRKRKENLSDDEIRRKIRKLENLARNSSRRRIIYSSSDSSVESNDDEDQTEFHADSHVVMVHHDASPRASSPGPASPRAAPPRATSPPVQDAPLPSPVPEESTDKEVPPLEEQELDDEILLLLGDAPKPDQKLGPPIHKDVASRWQEILSKGLERETKEKLLKQYLIPNNCELLLAPALNPEAKVALPEGLVKRDSYIMQKQSQLGVALSALASVTELILSDETSKQKLLKPLSDACRILCDSHQSETKTRRNFVLSAINTNLKDTLIEAQRDKYLFGENVSEKLKIAKNIQKSGESLKNQQKPTFTKTNFIANKGNLNSKPTHRKTDNKTTYGPTRTARQPRPSLRPQPHTSASNSSRRAPVAGYLR